MKVLQVITYIASARGGPSHSTLSAIRAYVEADPEAWVTLLSTKGLFEAKDRERIRGELDQRSNVVLRRLYGRHTTAYSPGLARWMMAHVRTYDLVVIRTMMNPQMTSAAAIARHAGVPYVITPHGALSSYVFEHRNTSAKRAYMKYLESRSLRGAAAVQCTTDEEAEQVRRLGYARRIEVVPHPVHVSHVSDEPSEPGTVVCLARIDPVKGFDVLLPAFARLAAVRPQARLVIAGAGAAAYEGRLRAEIAAAGLTDRVEFPGFVDGRAKADVLARAAVVVLPSRKENFGLTVVEAMVASRPVIVSPEVNLAPVVESADAGWVVPRDARALADAMQVALDAPDLAAAKGARGAAYAARHFSPAAVGDRLSALYHDVVARAAHPLPS